MSKFEGPFESGEVLWYTGGLQIDADGAPNAYGPHGGLDFIGNAGKPGNWWGVVTDGDGNPIVQGNSDPAPGFYISTTALVDPSKKRADPIRYVDSATIPYISVPKDAVTSYGIHVGDLGYAYNINNQQGTWAIIADVGPKGKWGEGSIALAEALGIESSPKHGGCESGIVFLVFRGSKAGWARDLQEAANTAMNLLAEAGGIESFLS